MKEKMNIGNCSLRGCFMVLAVVAALGLCGCNSRETLLLESEDLVKAVSGPESYAEGEASRGTGTEIEAETAQEPERSAAAAVKQVEESTLFVHICGAVREPGVYELAGGSRVCDAVGAAGGFDEAADESYVNMALLLEDGWKIVIPTLAETDAMQPEGSKGYAGEGLGIVAGTEKVPGRTGENEADGSGLVNINTAGREELCTLTGIGESRADSIIAYRESNGGFTGIEDIMQVEGIKEGMFAKLKDRICVN